MNLRFQIILISSLFWLLPFFRQRKSKYRYYFFTLALCDPITLSLIFLRYTALDSFFMVSLSQHDPVLFYIISWFSSDTDYIYLLLYTIVYFMTNKLEFLKDVLILDIIVMILVFTGIGFNFLDKPAFILLQIIILFRFLYNGFSYSKINAYPYFSEISLMGTLFSRCSLKPSVSISEKKIII